MMVKKLPATTLLLPFAACSPLEPHNAVINLSLSFMFFSLCFEWIDYLTDLFAAKRRTVVIPEFQFRSRWLHNMFRGNGPDANADWQPEPSTRLPTGEYATAIR